MFCTHTTYEQTYTGGYSYEDEDTGEIGGTWVDSWEGEDVSMMKKDKDGVSRCTMCGREEND